MRILPGWKRDCLSKKDQRNRSPWHQDVLHGSSTATTCGSTTSLVSASFSWPHRSTGKPSWPAENATALPCQPWRASRGADKQTAIGRNMNRYTLDIRITVAHKSRRRAFIFASLTRTCIHKHHKHGVFVLTVCIDTDLQHTGLNPLRVNREVLAFNIPDDCIPG